MTGTTPHGNLIIFPSMGDQKGAMELHVQKGEECY